MREKYQRYGQYTVYIRLGFKHLVDNLLDNHKFTKKIYVLTRKLKQQRDKVKYNLNMRDKIVTKINICTNIISLIDNIIFSLHTPYDKQELLVLGC